MTSTPQARMLRVLSLAEEVPSGVELDEFLSDPDSGVRRTALAILVESAPPDAGTRLATALLDNDATVRGVAIAGLRELRELIAADASLRRVLRMAASAVDPAVRTLTFQLQREHHLGDEVSFAAGLEDGDPDVRREAIAGLVALGCWEAATTARHDPDPVVRLHVAKALATIADPAGGDALATLADDDDTRVRAAALEAFATIGCPPVLAAIATRALNDPAWSVRKGAALGLAAAPAEMAVRPLLAAVDDENLDVRKAVVQSLSDWAPRMEDVATALISKLEDPDADVRAFARMALS